MNDEELLKMAKDHGFESEELLDMAYRLAREVERETRHRFFRVIQTANNAASHRAINAREIDAFIWNVERGKNDG